MDNSTDLTKSILQTIDSNSINVNNLESIDTTDSGTGVFGFFQTNIMQKLFIIFLVLLTVWFIVYFYLLNGKKSVADIISDTIKKIFSIFGMTGAGIVDNSAEGGKKVVNTTSDVIDTTLTNVQQGLPDTPQGNKVSSSISSTNVKNTIPQPDVMKNNTLNQALNKSNVKQMSTNDYEADSSNSNIQKGPSKSGYCYIGEDQGYRSCMYVNDSDQCMSGDIFPSKEICVNPTLRT
jgi:hypothetical protein